MTASRWLSLCIILYIDTKFKCLNANINCSSKETQLFYENGEDTDQWTLATGNSNDIFFNLIDTSIGSCYSGNCIAVRAETTSGTAGTAETALLSANIAIADYTSITMKFSLYPYGLTSGTLDECSVWYIVDGALNLLPLTPEYDKLNIIDETLEIEDANPSNLQLKIKNYLKASTITYCWFDEIRICGTSTSDGIQTTITPDSIQTTMTPGSIQTTLTPHPMQTTITTITTTNRGTTTTRKNSATSSEALVSETTDISTVFTEERFTENEEDSFLEEFTVTFVVALVIVVIASSIDGKCARPNDYFEVGTMVKSALQILDFLSDVIFMVRIANHPDVLSRWYLLILCILSVLFILLPVSISLFQLQSIITTHWQKNDDIRGWLQDRSYHLFMLSFLCGNSFSAINVCSSNAFDLRVFSMPLSSLDRAHFQYRRVYSVVLLENLPQLLIALCYTFITGGNDIIVYVSMSFSALSILMMVAAMQTLKQLINTQDHSIICVNVTGSITAKNIKFCQRKTATIKLHMSVLLGVDESLIEIPKPQQIHQGLQLNVILLINNATSANLDVEGKLSDAKMNESISEYVKESWHLEESPKITVVNYKQNESKEHTTEKDHLKTTISLTQTQIQ